MSKKPKLRSLSIFLMRSDVPPEKRLRADLTSHTAEIGTLHVQKSSIRPPKWLELFAGALTEQPDVHNASSAAVLIVERPSGTFAITFGQGRYLLEPGSWEESFGLRVTVNCVDPDRLKSVDKRTFDAYSSQSRTQTSKEGNIAAFGLDVQQDVLRAATGFPLDPDLGQRMTGMDSLIVSAHVTLKTIPDLLDKYEKSFRDESYKKSFPWIDHIAEVRDNKLKGFLDEQLIAMLKAPSRRTQSIWMAMPELLAWELVDGVRYDSLRAGNNDPDVHLDKFTSHLKDMELSIKVLKNRHVYVIGTDDHKIIRKWPAYSCLYAEIEREGKRYLLSDSKWYRIDQDLVVSVNAEVACLVRDSCLPDYDDAKEGAYNERVSEDSGGNLACLDRKLIRVGGTTIEPCDLYSAGREFIHVKRYAASSVLSHLFAQGTVAANAFVTDVRFRKLLNERLPTSHQLPSPEQRPDATQYKVIYAVVSRSNEPIDKSLPFFSRLNLRNAAKQLRGYGFAVELTKIKAV